MTDATLLASGSARGELVTELRCKIGMTIEWPYFDASAYDAINFFNPDVQFQNSLQSFLRIV